MYLGDSQMFPVDSKFRQEVWDWAEKSGIKIEYNGTDFGQDVWRVVDPKHCNWFVLKWS